jgi:hypothetical protein
MKWIVALVLVAGCFDDDGGGGGGGGGGSCDAFADRCAGENICIAGRCEAAFGRIYSITNVQVTVPTTDPQGAPWDVGGGAPDLLLEISVDGAKVADAPAVPDQFSATFTGPFSVTLIGGSALVVSILDEDLTVNDPAFACGADPITADQLRARALGCMQGANNLSLGIAPR